jgi:hypothetical protein
MASEKHFEGRYGRWGTEGRQAKISCNTSWIYVWRKLPPAIGRKDFILSGMRKSMETRFKCFRTLIPSSLPEGSVLQTKATNIFYHIIMEFAKKYEVNSRHYS